MEKKGNATCVEEKKEPNVKLMRSMIRNGVTQVLAASICTAVLLLFVILTYSQITLPRYTAAYDQKDTQQVVNLLITVVAAVIGILLTHCRRLTNEAETRSELRNAELTLPRLHVHFEAAGGSKAAMSIPAVHNKAVWYLVFIYLFTMIIFGFVHSVLSVIFVVEGVISSQGEPVPVHFPLPLDVPEEVNGKVIDPCSKEIGEPGCAYDLALTSFTSELVTVQPYTIAGVTFEPPNGTMGLPYGAMLHFSKEVRESPFEEEHRRYCLPVLEPHIISCTEVPFDQESNRTVSDMVQYKVLEVYRTEKHRQQFIPGAGVYQIATPYPCHIPWNCIKYRTNDEGQGTFLTHMREGNTADEYTSLIAASNSGTDGYASLLYRMMYGKDPDLSVVPQGQSLYFVAKCELSHIAQQNASYSSWRQVDFTLKSGVLRANVTDKRCPSSRGPEVSGFKDLQFYLEGTGDVLSSSDGYSKLFNENVQDGAVAPGAGSTIFEGMSRLDATVNKIYHLVQTAWSQQTYAYSMQAQDVSTHPITMTSYPHLYVIRINWTPTTYIGLALSILITLNAYMLFARWIRAVYRFGFDAETWNLLRPVDLMAYSLAAWHELISDLHTVEQRRAALHGDTSTILREHPGWKAMYMPQSPNSSHDQQSSQSPFSTAVAKPCSNFVGQVDSLVDGPGQKPIITVQTSERDLERGE